MVSQFLIVKLYFIRLLPVATMSDRSPNNFGAFVGINDNDLLMKEMLDALNHASITTGGRVSCDMLLDTLEKLQEYNVFLL